MKKIYKTFAGFYGAAKITQIYKTFVYFIRPPNNQTKFIKLLFYFMGPPTKLNQIYKTFVVFYEVL